MPRESGELSLCPTLTQSNWINNFFRLNVGLLTKFDELLTSICNDLIKLW